LHLRSGFPVDKYAELHGNIFKEKCDKCEKEYFRNFDVGTIGFKRTGRRCSINGCNGYLRDVLLDWNDPLPEKDLQRAERESNNADLVICLGTSLRVEPANKIPALTRKNGGKLVICNLQKTPKDYQANLRLFAKCDKIMQYLIQKLSITLPIYTRYECFIIKILSSKNGRLILTILGEDGYQPSFIRCVDITLSGKFITTVNNTFQYEWLYETNQSLISITIHFTSCYNLEPLKLDQEITQASDVNIEINQTVNLYSLDYNIRNIKIEEPVIISNNQKKLKAELKHKEKQKVKSIKTDPEESIIKS